jgi:hypothetical protein
MCFACEVKDNTCDHRCFGATVISALEGKFKCMQEALMLLAYAHPSSSPAAHLLSPKRRQRCSAVLNGALMQRSTGNKRSALDRLCRQLVVVHQEMCASGVLAGGALDLGDALPQRQTS